MSLQAGTPAPWRVGSDHAGGALRQAVAQRLRAWGHPVVDLGHDGPAKSDYPQVAHLLARQLAQHGGKGVLVCGSGVGVSVVANRVPGVRAALCAHTLVAQLSRRHNDANVLCLGAQVVGLGLGLSILEAFATTPFDGGRHLHRLAQIDAPPQELA